jgi:hypothetical protein
MLLAQAKLLGEQASRLQNTGVNIFSKQGAVAYFLLIKQINQLCVKYNLIVPKFNAFFVEEGIDQKIDQSTKIETDFETIKQHTLSDTETPLMDIIFGAQTMVTFLDISSEISEENVDRLSSIIKELNSIKSDIDATHFQNIGEARNEFEKGAFLGASLICGKVVSSCIDQISGKDINDKIASLKDAGLVREKDGRDFLLKANHFARNLTSHDITIFPTSSEAISYLGDAIKIARIYSDFKKMQKIVE